MNTIIVLLVLFLLGGRLSAQDIHYTQFEMAPLSVNPSLTGKYEGTFRIGGLYRDQWRSVISNQFVTPSIYVDGPAFRGFRKNDWVGLGAVLVYDKAGTVSLTNMSVMGSLAYHLGLGNTTVSIGGQAGIMQRRVDLTELRTQDMINNPGSVTSQDLQNIDDDKKTVGDYNAGVSVHSKLNQNFDFNVGLALHHLSQPNYSLLTDAANATTPDDLDRLGLGLVGTVGMNIGVAPKWTIAPSFLYQGLQGASEILIQTMAKRHFNLEKDISFNFGAGYRWDDAVSPMIGMDYKGFKVGIAYDINISQLGRASVNRWGFELGVSYTAKIRKPVVVKPVIFCPRF